MTHLKRGPVLIGAILLLAACGGSASSSSAAHTPSAAPTATAAALVKGSSPGLPLARQARQASPCRPTDRRSLPTSVTAIPIP